MAVVAGAMGGEADSWLGVAEVESDEFKVSVGSFFFCASTASYDAAAGPSLEEVVACVVFAGTVLEGAGLANGEIVPRLAGRAGALVAAGGLDDTEEVVAAGERVAGDAGVGEAGDLGGPLCSN